MDKVLRIVLGSLAVVFILLSIGLIGGLEHRYTVEAEVSNVYDGMVFFTDTRGHVWSKNCDSKIYRIGENVKLVMHDNITQSVISDDYILKVKK